MEIDLSKIFSLDQAARAYGWEVGRGKPISETIEISEDNPFMDSKWRRFISDNTKESL